MIFAEMWTDLETEWSKSERGKVKWYRWTYLQRERHRWREWAYGYKRKTGEVGWIGRLGLYIYIYTHTIDAMYEVDNLWERTVLLR